MKIIDISWPLSENMTSYKNKLSKRLSIQATRVYQKHGVNESRIVLNSHTGTHVDAPKHFVKNGKGLDGLDKFVGPCRVVEIKSKLITEEELAKLNVKKNEIILFKTRNSNKKDTALFDKDFVYLGKTGAEYLVKRKIKTVGIDYLGIENKQPKHETHKVLLRNNIGIIEGLRLKNVKPGKYMLICLPLLIKGIDAAPARAILTK